MRTPFAPLLALLLAWSLASPTTAQEWEEATPLRTARAGAAGVVAEGRLFVIGGRDAEGRPLASVEVFELGVGWIVIDSLRTARVNAAAAVHGGRVVVMGGSDADGEPIADAEAYDPEQKVWTPFDPLRTPREGLGAAGVDSTIYVIGGAGPEGVLFESVETYAEVWAPLTTWRLTPARAQFGTVVQDSAIVVVGGFSAVGPIRDVERFDPATGTVTALPSLPFPTGGLAAAVHDGRIFAVGGRNADDMITRRVLELTPSTGWEPRTQLPQAVEGAVAAVLDSRLYVVGGSNFSGGVTDGVYRLSLQSVDVAAEPPPPGGLRLSVVGPNPSGHGTAFEVRGAGDVRLSIADVLGREVAVLHEGPVRDRVRVGWDGRVPAGVYVARVVGPEGAMSVPITVVR